jgi:neutral ceramidase
VAISGTHTHSGPGGYLQYVLYIITSLGFVRESFDVLVGGILEVRTLSMTQLVLVEFY